MTIAFDPNNLPLIVLDADDTAFNTRGEFIAEALKVNPSLDIAEALEWTELPLPPHLMERGHQNSMLSSAQFMSTVEPLPAVAFALAVMCRVAPVVIVTHRGYHREGKTRTQESMHKHFGALMKRFPINVHAIHSSDSKHEYSALLAAARGLDYVLVDDNIPYPDKLTIGGAVLEGEALRQHVRSHTVVLDQPWNHGPGFDGMVRVPSLLDLADMVTQNLTPQHRYNLHVATISEHRIAVERGESKELKRMRKRSIERCARNGAKLTLAPSDPERGNLVTRFTYANRDNYPRSV